jgi:hypothetical protein
MPITGVSQLANNQAGLIVLTVPIALSASLSSTFSVPGYVPVAIQTSGALTATTVGLDLLAASSATGTPVAAVTSSGNQISFTCVAGTAQYVSLVGQDMVVAPLYQLQAVASNGAAVVQNPASTVVVVMRRYLT